MSTTSTERKYGPGEAAPGAADMIKLYWLLGAVAVFGVAIVGHSVGSKGLGSMVSQPIAMEGLDDPARLMEMARGVVKGNAEAPITIIEFADFQCPVCNDFYRSVKPLIDAEFVNTGRAKFMFHDFPLNIHPNAFLAARAARCAEDQGRFWEYHDNLYRNQGRWSSLQNPAGVFEDYAESLALDSDAFGSCLRSDRHADVVMANMELATQFNAPGTPTIVVTAGRGVGRQVENSIEGIREAVALLEGTIGGAPR